MSVLGTSIPELVGDKVGIFPIDARTIEVVLRTRKVVPSRRLSTTAVATSVATPAPEPAPAVATGYAVAFQANTGNLWTVGAENRGDWKLGMQRATRPSIVALPAGGFEVAFQANTGNLWTVGADAHNDWGLGMMAGTSPKIAA